MSDKADPAVQVDLERDQITIYGVRYALYFFRVMAGLEGGCGFPCGPFEIVESEHGTTTIHKLNPEELRDRLLSAQLLRSQQ